MPDIYCPYCGCKLDDHDHVFGVWVCPRCDEVEPDLPDERNDLPEAP